jgi:hypothetical protein
MNIWGVGNLALVVIGFASYATVLITKYYFIGRLRDTNPALWAELGRPSIFPEGGFGNLAFLKFVLKRKYRILEDRKIDVFATRLRVAWLFHVLSWSLIALFLVMWSLR